MKKTTAKKVNLETLKEMMVSDMESIRTYEFFEKNIRISSHNAKMGPVPSVSLPSGVTCNPTVSCFASCYAHKLENIRGNVKESYIVNLMLYGIDKGLYESVIDDYMKLVAVFRWNVSGDIVTPAYLEMIIRLTRKNPHCNTLLFTKRYEWINAVVGSGSDIPENLQVLFSEDFGKNPKQMDNPYDFPVVKVIGKKETIPNNGIVCGGNCAACKCRNTGCWNLKKGDILYIIKH